MSNNPHRRTSSGFLTAPPNEDLDGQLDRLNQALRDVMQDIECSSYTSRVSSRMSLLPSDVCLEVDHENHSVKSDDLHFPPEIEARIEELLQTIDRDEMIIEDFRAEEVRKSNNSSKQTIPEYTCGHDMVMIRCEIELQLKMQRNLQLDKERKDFEVKLRELDYLKEDYMQKRKEILLGIEKLNAKEKILEQKEKDLRASRMAFDRHRCLWEQDHGSAEIQAKAATADMPANLKPPLALDHSRRPSSSRFSEVSSSLPVGMSFKSMLSQKPEVSAKVTEDGAPASCIAKLESYQEELKGLEQELEQEQMREFGCDTSGLELKIDQLKNKIAAIRGERVMSESVRTTKLMSSIMMSIQKQSAKEDANTKRSQLFERMNKKALPAGETPKQSQKEVFRIKQLEQKVPENSETTRRFLFSDAPTPKGIHTPRNSDKEDSYRMYFENKKKMLVEKEKELNQKESMLQETWMKLPGAKELIDNVNFVLAKMNSDKITLESQREELEKDRLEFLKMKEKFVLQHKREEKKVA